jgi:hypothetical protein
VNNKKKKNKKLSHQSLEKHFSPQ